MAKNTTTDTSANLCFEAKLWAAAEEYDGMPFQDLIRSANEQGLLLSDWPKWKSYRDMRSKTSHTYDDQVALEVVADIPAFLQEARYLRDQIQQRQIG